MLSQFDAQNYEPTRREVCISVTGPTRPPAVLSDRFLAVLRVSFSDITEPVDRPDHVLFNEEHAREIARFAADWRDVDRMVVHCQGGMSRSPGIAAGLCELFAWGSAAAWEKSHPLWNKWVRGELVRVGREMITGQTL